MLKSYFRSPLFDAAGDDGAAGGGGGFDQAAFAASIMASVNTAMTGFQKSYRADFAKLTPPAPVVAEPVVAADPVVTDAAGAPKDPALAAQLRAMERRLKESDERAAASDAKSAARELAADNKELASVVRTGLSKFKLADGASEDAFEIFGSKIKRNEDGAFVGLDGTPIDQFLEEGLRLKPYLLAPKDVGGAGARGGKAQGGGKAFDFDGIKQGMSAADVSAAAAEISAVLAGQR